MPSLFMVLRDHSQNRLVRGSHAFSGQKIISCTLGICADVKAEVNGDFHPNFYYRSPQQFACRFSVVRTIPSIFSAYFCFFVSVFMESKLMATVELGCLYVNLHYHVADFKFRYRFRGNESEI